MIKKDKIKKECNQCNCVFEVYEYRTETAKFCSKKCKNNSQKGIDIFKGMDRYWLRGNKNAEDSGGSSTSFQIGQLPWNKGKKHPAVAGDKNPNWKGGVTSKNELIRKSGAYKEWRFSVYERDNYTCMSCRGSESGTLNAHHIKRFADYPELRLDIDNGITLCKSCHQEEHARQRLTVRPD